MPSSRNDGVIRDKLEPIKARAYAVICTKKRDSDTDLPYDAYIMREALLWLGQHPRLVRDAVDILCDWPEDYRAWDLDSLMRWQAARSTDQRAALNNLM